MTNNFTPSQDGLKDTYWYYMLVFNSIIHLVRKELQWNDELLTSYRAHYILSFCGKGNADGVMVSERKGVYAV